MAIVGATLVTLSVNVACEVLLVTLSVNVIVTVVGPEGPSGGVNDQPHVPLLVPVLVDSPNRGRDRHGVAIHLVECTAVGGQATFIDCHGVGIDRRRRRAAVVVNNRAGSHRAGGNGRRLRGRGAVTVPNVAVKVSLASIVVSPFTTTVIVCVSPAVPAKVNTPLGKAA